MRLVPYQSKEKADTLLYRLSLTIMARYDTINIILAYRLIVTIIV